MGTVLSIWNDSHTKHSSLIDQVYLFCDPEINTILNFLLHDFICIYPCFLPLCRVSFCRFRLVVSFRTFFKTSLCFSKDKSHTGLKTCVSVNDDKGFSFRISCPALSGTIFPSSQRLFVLFAPSVSLFLSLNPTGLSFLCETSSFNSHGFPFHTLVYVSSLPLKLYDCERDSPSVYCQR